MSVTSTPSCQCCQFYHGANQVLCGPHPYGPDSETCSDYVPKASSLNQDQTSRDRWSSQPFLNWKFWQQFLVMVLGILVGVLGSGCLAVWLTTYNPTRQQPRQSPRVSGSDRVLPLYWLHPRAGENLKENSWSNRPR